MGDITGQLAHEGSADTAAAKALARIVDRWRTSQEVVPVLILGAGKQDGTIQWANRACQRMVGYGYEELVGKHFDLLWGEAKGVGGWQPFKENLDQGHTTPIEVEWRRQDGSSFWCEVAAGPVWGDDNELVNYTVYPSDISELVAARETARIQSAEQARQRDRLSLLSELWAQGDHNSAVALRRAVAAVSRHFDARCALVALEPQIEVLADSAGAGKVGTGSVRVANGHPEHDPLGQLRATDSKAPIKVITDAAQATGLTAAILADLAGSWGPVIGVYCLLDRRGPMALFLVDLEPDAVDPEDRTLLSDVALRLAAIRESGRLYQQQHLVAETLQRSMLPVPATLSDLDCWTHYAPNVAHAQIGGDWFDVLPQDDSSVGFVIGDVVGHDIEAAAVMGQLRSVVRAYAFSDDDPGAVLMRVDQLVKGMRISRSASMVYARLDPVGDGSWDMTYSRGGHLPPLLLREGTVTQLMGSGGPMIGFSTVPRRSDVVELEPGDVVVFYTDGLIERRDRRQIDGLRDLTEACADLVPTDAAGIGEQLLERIGQALEDDMAMLVLRLPRNDGEPDAIGPRSRRWQLTSDPASIGLARRLVAQTCALWGVQSGQEALLVTSELAANAVLHGWGTVTLHLKLVDDRLLIEFYDENPTPPRYSADDPTQPGGFGMHVVNRLAEWGWREDGNGKVVWAKMRQASPTDTSDAQH